MENMMKFDFPVRPLLLGLVALTLAGTTHKPALATHSSGEVATLVALVGEPERYVVFYKNNVQDVPTASCDNVVVIDLDAAEPRELYGKNRADGAEVDVDPSDENAWRSYVRACTVELGVDAPQGGWRWVDSDAGKAWEFYVFPDDSEGTVRDDRFRAPPGFTHLVPELIVEKRVRDVCVVLEGDEGATCATCEDCATCTSDVIDYRFGVRNSKTGFVALGTRFVASPDKLSQVQMACDGVYDGSVEMEVTQLGVFETPTNYIFYGAATHEPTLNDTNFAIVAVMPKAGGKVASANSSPRGCACEGGGSDPVIWSFGVGILAWLSRRRGMLRA